MKKINVIIGYFTFTIKNNYFFLAEFISNTPENGTYCMIGKPRLADFVARVCSKMLENEKVVSRES